jgi:monoamine oxidase
LASAAVALPGLRPEAYKRLIELIDLEGRVYLAGNSVSYWAGWQEGAVRSAWWTLGQIREHAAAQAG